MKPLTPIEQRDFAFTLLECTDLTEQTDADLKTIQSWLSDQPESDRRARLTQRVDTFLNPIELKWHKEAS